MRLADLDGKRIAVVLRNHIRTRVLLGTARYESLASVLMIRVNADWCGSDEELELAIDEDEWSGKLVADDRHGCEYRIELSAQ